MGFAYQRRFGHLFAGGDLAIGRVDHSGDLPICHLPDGEIVLDVLDWVGWDARVVLSAGVSF